MVGGCGDHRGVGSDYEAVAGALPGARLPGLYDRRKRRPSPKKVALGTAEKVLRLYREKYFDFNVRHFHEKLVEEHGIQLRYTR
jgi:hypothetical protein